MRALWSTATRPQRYQPTQREDEDALTRVIVAIAGQYGRYGYRRIRDLLRYEGWHVGKDWVERICYCLVCSRLCPGAVVVDNNFGALCRKGSTDQSPKILYSARNDHDFPKSG
ncbi:MAG: Integrase catalytic region [Acidobacteriaceae bacterium]|nr:Integrase catalytic region [Acidobacteriaceae bacterium]